MYHQNRFLEVSSIGGTADGIKSNNFEDIGKSGSFDKGKLIRLHIAVDIQIRPRWHLKKLKSMAY